MGGGLRAVDAEHGRAVICAEEAGEGAYDYTSAVFGEMWRAGGLPGAKPANSRTLMPVKGGDCVMLEMSCYGI